MMSFLWVGVIVATLGTIFSFYADWNRNKYIPIKYIEMQENSEIIFRLGILIALVTIAIMLNDG